MLTNEDFNATSKDKKFDNTLAPPIPPRSTSNTPTDSPMISPRHSSAHNKPKRISNNNLDLDTLISEQSSTFVKKPLNCFDLDPSSSTSTVDNYINSFLGASKHNGQTSLSSNNNISLNNLSTNLPRNQNKPEFAEMFENDFNNRILKTSKSSLHFSNFNNNNNIDKKKNDLDSLSEQIELLRKQILSKNEEGQTETKVFSTKPSNNHAGRQ